MATTIKEDIAGIAESASACEMPVRYRVIGACVLALIALFSAFVLSGILSSPATYKETIHSLDERKETVIALTTVTTGASAVVSVLPDDACTPISEKLADLSMCFFVVLSAICFEKYMLTTCGFVTGAFIVPLCCILLIVAILLSKRNEHVRYQLISVSAKLFALGVAFTLAVPASMFISGMIEDTYEESIQAAIEDAKTATENVETAEEPQHGEATNPIEFVSFLVQDIEQAANDAAEAIANALEQMKDAVVRLFEAAAVMLVLSCAIPILVLVLLIWVTRLLTGISIEMPTKLPRLRAPWLNPRLP